MPIPQDILSVPRPKNTVVIAYGKDKSLFAVRQRVGCRNDNGRHLPVNGPTIGHIIDGVYVPIDKKVPNNVSISPIDLKDWANIILCDRLFSDIREELSAVYSQTDLMKIYCISILRVCDPGIKNYELKEAYETSFLSELYPGIALSKNTVSTFLNDMGKAVSKIVRFMQNRTAAVSMDHHLLVDGTLKSDESKVNSLSDFSRKARTKGTRDISVLYAFDSRHVLRKELVIMGSYVMPYGMMEELLDFMVEKKVNLDVLVSHHFQPEDAQTAFDISRAGQSGKVIISFDD